MTFKKGDEVVFVGKSTMGMYGGSEVRWDALVSDGDVHTVVNTGSFITVSLYDGGGYWNVGAEDLTIHDVELSWL